MSVRADMEEYLRNILSESDGEMAAVGTYTVRWVEGINKDRRFDNKEWRAMKGLMKAVAQGARGVLLRQIANRWGAGQRIYT